MVAWQHLQPCWHWLCPLTCRCARPLPAAVQRALEGWVRGTSRVPLVGWLSGRAVEILVGVQRYYTYVERLAAG